MNEAFTNSDRFFQGETWAVVKPPHHAQLTARR